MKKILLICVFVLLAIYAFAAAPVVSNLVSTPSTARVFITYDLVADGACKITVVVSADGGASYNIYPSALSGATGDQVSPGIGKQIIWNPAADGMQVGANYKVKVIARNNPIQNDVQFTSFIKVEGGTFSRQDNNGSYPNPQVMITLSTFYIDKYEVTQNDYQAVMGTNQSYFRVNPNRPVERASWFNAIEYCNRRSLQEGLMPCYSYSSYGSNPDNWPGGWNLINDNHTNVSCNWTANGYRLATEMEWMFAAKGGNQSQGYTYCGSNMVDDVAWYLANSNDRTWDVGLKDPNEIGTFDMSGNVYEWVWDIFGTYPSGNQTNPTGPTSGTNRAARSGGWAVSALGCSNFYRFTIGAAIRSAFVGFRLCRSVP